MTKEREEHFLDHVFGLVGAQAERSDIAQQRRRAAIEQQQHLFVGSTRRDARALDREQREVENVDSGFSGSMRCRDSPGFYRRTA